MNQSLLKRYKCRRLDWTSLILLFGASKQATTKLKQTNKQKQTTKQTTKAKERARRLLKSIKLYIIAKLS
jgi:hypothetical protein